MWLQVVRLLPRQHRWPEPPLPGISVSFPLIADGRTPSGAATGSDRYGRS
jgi:hypothetical protein